MPSPKLGIHEISSSTKNNLLSCKFRINETGFRFLRLVSTRNWDFKFSVYDFTFNGMDGNEEVGGDTGLNNDALENNDN